MNDAVSRLESSLKDVIEMSESDEQWFAMWISYQAQEHYGVTGADDTLTRVRKALRIPDSVEFLAPKQPIDWAQSIFWDTRYYTHDDVEDPALKAGVTAATAVFKEMCVPGSVTWVDFSVWGVFPNMVAGVTKGGHLLVAYATVVST